MMISIIPNGIAIIVIHKIIPISKIANPIATVISLPVNLNTNPTSHQINKNGQNNNMPKKCNTTIPSPNLFLHYYNTFNLCLK